MQGLREAPNAVYALVQTVLVQDEALKRANEPHPGTGSGGAVSRSRPQSGGFLDSMRDTIFGQNQPARLGAERARARNAGGSRPAWNSGQVLQQGHSRARTIWSAGLRPALWRRASSSRRRSAAVAARFSEPRRRPRPAWSADRCCRQHPLDDGRRRQPSGFGDTGGHSGGIEDRRPWSDQSGSSLARDAGINDIGSSAGAPTTIRSGSRQGFFDQDSTRSRRSTTTWIMRFRRFRRRRRRQRLRLSGVAV